MGVHTCIYTCTCSLSLAHTHTQGRTHVFENEGGSSIGLTGSSQTLSGGSTISPSAFGLGLPPYAIHDESMSSSQSISSSNSGKHSEEQEEIEQPES